MNSQHKKKIILFAIMWIGISLGICLAISILLPFPLSLVTIIGLFILLNLYMRKTMKRRMGGGGGEMFGSMFPPSISVDGSLKYYCMSCGREHKQIECPKCGSKMKRVGS
jgi:hypothetical protein